MHPAFRSRLPSRLRAFALVLALAWPAPSFARDTATATTKTTSKTKGKAKAKTKGSTGATRTRGKTVAHAKTAGKTAKSNAHKKTVASADTGDATFFLGHRAANVVPNQHGKIVLFPFRDDDDGAVATQVGQLLEQRGLEVVTGVRRVDSAEQYRDVATQLELVAYVDGDVGGSDDKSRATVRLRNGTTGRTVTQATFRETRANLPRELSDNLWKKLGGAMARACTDAEKPRKQGRATLRINAGTPLEPTPPPPAKLADDEK